MRTKIFHTVRLYTSHLRALTREVGRPVSAGELAKYAGVSRNTAKKYLEMTVREGLASRVTAEHFNGMVATGYTFEGDVQ